MIQQLIKILIFLGISERWAVAITIAPTVAMVTWAGVGVYSSFVDFSEQINTIELQNQLLLEETRIIREVNHLLVSYVGDLSMATELSTDNMVLIIKETAKKPVNESLIKRIEEDISNDQKNLLPHNKIKRDSTRYVIHVRPIPHKR